MYTRINPRIQHSGGPSLILSWNSFWFHPLNAVAHSFEPPWTFRRCNIATATRRWLWLHATMAVAIAAGNVVVAGSCGDGGENGRPRGLKLAQWGGILWCIRYIRITVTSSLSNKFLGGKKRVCETYVTNKKHERRTTLMVVMLVFRHTYFDVWDVTNVLLVVEQQLRYELMCWVDSCLGKFLGALVPTSFSMAL